MTFPLSGLLTSRIFLGNGERVVCNGKTIKMKLAINRRSANMPAIHLRYSVISSLTTSVPTQVIGQGGAGSNPGDKQCGQG